MNHSDTSSQTKKPIFSKIAVMSLPIAIVAALSIFFGFLFLPFGIVFGLIALIVIGFQVFRHEAVESE